MNFDLRTPCKNCPFSRRQRGFLTAARAAEILEGITTGDGTFSCHKTVEYGEGDGEDTPGEDGPNTFHCAGALIFLEKLEMPNQMMRIAERLGYYDRFALDMSADVVESGEEFIRHHAESRAAR